MELPFATAEGASPLSRSTSWKPVKRSTPSLDVQGAGDGRDTAPASLDEVPERQPGAFSVVDVEGPARDVAGGPAHQHGGRPRLFDVSGQRGVAPERTEQDPVDVASLEKRSQPVAVVLGLGDSQQQLNPSVRETCGGPRTMAEK
ncbi:hypothetical protein ACWKT3_16640 [Streptomyces violaceus]